MNIDSGTGSKMSREEWDDYCQMAGATDFQDEGTVTRAFDSFGQLVGTYDSISQSGTLVSEGSMKFLSETKRDVRRLMGDEINSAFEDSFVYEILDDDSQEGCYYIIINKEKTNVILTSITTDAEVNQADLLMLASKVLCCEPIIAENGFIFEGPIEDILSELIDVHSAIILQDLNNESENTDNPDALPLEIPAVTAVQPDEAPGAEEPTAPDQAPAPQAAPIQMPAAPTQAPPPGM
jgi:hypothetical protein